MSKNDTTATSVPGEVLNFAKGIVFGVAGRVARAVSPTPSRSNSGNKATSYINSDGGVKGGVQDFAAGLIFGLAEKALTRAISQTPARSDKASAANADKTPSRQDGGVKKEVQDLAAGLVCGPAKAVAPKPSKSEKVSKKPSKISSNGSVNGEVHDFAEGLNTDQCLAATTSVITIQASINVSVNDDIENEVLDSKRRSLTREVSTLTSNNTDNCSFTSTSISSCDSVVGIVINDGETDEVDFERDLAVSPSSTTKNTENHFDTKTNITRSEGDVTYINGCVKDEILDFKRRVVKPVSPTSIRSNADNQNSVKKEVLQLVGGTALHFAKKAMDRMVSPTTCPESSKEDKDLDNPNILFHQDMKNGGTPLHWAKSRVVIDSLIDAHCHINAVNFEGKTALHVMVERCRLDCVVALLSRSAKPDLPDKNGNRPIHLAVKADSLPVIQALIIFGADLNVLNNDGETPRHLIPKDKQEKILYYMHAVGAKRCAPKKEGCNDGCIAGGTFDGVPPPKVLGPTNRDVLNQIIAVAGMDVASKKNKRNHLQKNGRLLCLDGGGIRGLILVQMLLELETTFKKSISNCFDWIAGTSTGGILALGIATGKTMKECQSLYFRMKEQAFVGSRPYCSDNFETMMKDTFGADTVMSDIKYPKIMITGLLVDRKPAELHLFRNYNSPNDILRVKHDSPYELPPPPEQQFIWQVARATGAAPTYFRMFQRYLDGGLIANNPTLDALTEIHEYCLALKATGKEEEMCPASIVVSLGTGVIPTTELTALDVYRPENAWDFTKLFYGISNMATLLIDQATLSDGRVIDRARGWCSMIGVPYFRFSPQISEEVAMDEKDDVKLCNMLWETKAYMHENYVLMRELADLLG